MKLTWQVQIISYMEQRQWANNQTRKHNFGKMFTAKYQEP